MNAIGDDTHIVLERKMLCRQPDEATSKGSAFDSFLILVAITLGHTTATTRGTLRRQDLINNAITRRTRECARLQTPNVELRALPAMAK